MPNNPPAPAGYVLVTEGVVQEGDFFLSTTQGRWMPFIEEDFGDSVETYVAVLRPPQPEASERERELREALLECVTTLERASRMLTEEHRAVY